MPISTTSHSYPKRKIIMSHQAAIEQKAGINQEIAIYMMSANTKKANQAMSLLKMVVDHYDEPSMALLEEAVKECAQEMEESKKVEGSTQWAISQILGG